MYIVLIFCFCCSFSLCFSFCRNSQHIVYLAVLTAVVFAVSLMSVRETYYAYYICWETRK